MGYKLQIYNLQLDTGFVQDYSNRGNETDFVVFFEVGLRVRRLTHWSLLLLVCCAMVSAAHGVEQTFYFTSLQYGGIDTKRNASICFQQ